ncbi:RelA/SpoT domain-containing protein [Parvularcula oceani]|uniref:RelA/SpoT domain-containing protein n=1 Tax=Parvularcula oceani TaxID=1247963 RepID=UPI0009DD1BB1|nr:RelA/SpoT domain-containing protein [Parvularcula oceani]
MAGNIEMESESSAPNRQASEGVLESGQEPRMTLSDYEARGRDLYARYADAVRQILLAALARHPEIRHQEVQARAKAVDSLRKKLGDAAGTSVIQQYAKDLAGVRIVLYTDSDLDRLEGSGLLHENFSIEWERTRFHYPVSGDKDVSHFIGRNYVALLTDARTSLPEYADLSSLRCEIQVQTILQHAWSETAHDKIYKSPDLGEVGARNLVALKTQMNAIQRRYLIPAGHEFQKVLDSFERLAQGKKLIDTDALEAIERATNNNDVSDLLDRFQNFVLPEIDKIQAWAPDIRRAALSAVRHASGHLIIPIKTPYGDIPGKTLEDVTKRAVRLINGPELRLVDPTATLHTLIDMYSIEGLDEEAKRLLVEAAAELSHYNLSAWRQGGPIVQKLLTETICGLDPKIIDTVRPLILKVASNALGTEIAGTSSNSESVTFTRGAVLISEDLNKIRDRAIALIEEAFNMASNDVERRRALVAYKQATSLHNAAILSDDLIVRVRLDTARMIRFLTNKAGVLSNPLLQSVERDIYLRYRWNQDTEGKPTRAASVAAAGLEVVSAALSFRDHISGFEDYEIFKTLVGFEGVFADAWEAPEFRAMYKLNDKARDERAAELLASVTVEGAPDWFERLDRYAATDSSDLATFPKLGKFITDIVARHPSIGPIWLDQSEGRPLERFVPGMLRGLYKAAPDSAVAWVEQAMQAGRYITSLAHFLNHADPPLPDLVEQMAGVAAHSNNKQAAISVLEFAVKERVVLGGERATKLGLMMIEYLAARSEDEWVNPVWLYSQDSDFIESLPKKDRLRFLRAVSTLRNIDHRTEEFLVKVARKHPNEVIDMFGKRIEFDKSEDNNPFDPNHFEAIPYEFHHLSEGFSLDDVDLVLEATSRWAEKSDWLNSYRGGRFVAGVYPDLPEELIRALREFTSSGDEARQEFAIAVIEHFESAPGVWVVAKELVAEAAGSDQLLSKIGSALQSTGTMHGHFGYRDALIEQKSKIEAWFDDEREAVRAFARTFARSLENQIANEQQRVERDIAQRRLEYGEPISSENDARPDGDTGG